MSIKHKDTKINPPHLSCSEHERGADKSGEENIIQKRPSNDPQDYFILTLIISVSFASFGLGRLSKIDTEEKQPIIFEKSLPAATLSAKNQISTISERQEGALVVSKNGKKYHFPWCSGAQRIKEENKLWFNSSTAAREAGYTPAANCNGLE